jgi:AcrR family transcriptional regulator
VTPKPGLREAKKYETRRALSFAAFELASERGLNGFLVEDVTDRVGVSRRTFFNYFNRKEEAVVEVSGFMFDDAVSELRDRPADEPLFDSLRAVVDLVVGPKNFVTINTLSRMAGNYPELVPYELAARERMVIGAHDALLDRMPQAQRSTFLPLALVHAAFGVIQAAITHAGERQDADITSLMDEAFGYLRTGFDPPQS